MTIRFRQLKFAVFECGGLLGIATMASLATSAEAAQFSLSFDHSDGKTQKALSKASPAQAEKFLRSVETLLPPYLKETLDRPAVIRLRKLDRNSVILPPQCPGEPPQSAKPSLLGLTAPIQNLGSKTVIILNRNFVTEIEKGPDSARTYACGHKNVYRLAVATVAHELTHEFDRVTGTQKSLAFERTVREPCIQSEGRDCPASLPSRLSAQDELSAALGIVHKNKLPGRSADPYEFSNSAEALAVNTEFFLLDPEFACRKPAIYSLLSKVFQISPHTPARCSAFSQVFSGQFVPYSLDPERVYEIHYLMASKGVNFSSRWGHAMFRVITCDPQRGSVGPDCLKDIRRHPVISFRAHITDTMTSMLKGIFGGYPSQLFVYGLPEVIQEYAVGESRDLISIPLKLRRDQIRAFLSATLEQYWSYQGRYAFMANNCATESLDLLLRAVAPDLFASKPIFDTPRKLYKILRNGGLLDESVLKAPRAAILDRYLFEGFKNQLQLAYSRIQESLPELRKTTLENFIEFSASRRMEFFQKTEDPRTAPYFMILEVKTREHLVQKVSKQMLAIAQKVQDGKAPPMGAALLQSYHKFNELMSKLAPWNLVTTGYGIPLESEVPTQEALRETLNELSVNQSRVLEAGQVLFAETHEQIRQVSKNIENFLSVVREQNGLRKFSSPNETKENP